MKHGFATRDEDVVEAGYTKRGRRRPEGRARLVPRARLLSLTRERAAARTIRRDERS